MRILLEAATESEWVAQHLETLGHEVIVADPNFTPMYGHRSRRVKTDRRDVAALAEACQRGFIARRIGAPPRSAPCRPSSTFVGN
jgi:transposase